MHIMVSRLNNDFAYVLVYEIECLKSYTLNCVTNSSFSFNVLYSISYKLCVCTVYCAMCVSGLLAR